MKERRIKSEKVGGNRKKYWLHLSMNLLFICSRNQWRSPTAEQIFKNKAGYAARSAGTEPSARVRISEKTLQWADLVFVMEKRHKQRLLDAFPVLGREKEIVVLDIPDDYQFMDPELVEMMEVMVNTYLDR